jgi:hypothetical protein
MAAQHDFIAMLNLRSLSGSLIKPAKVSNFPAECSGREVLLKPGLEYRFIRSTLLWLRRESNALRTPVFLAEPAAGELKFSNDTNPETRELWPNLKRILIS